MVAYQTSDGPNVPLGLWYWGSGFVVTVLGYLDEGSPTERQQPIAMLSPVTSIDSASPTFLSFLTYAFLSPDSFEFPESLRSSLRQRVIEFTKAREEQQVPGLQDSSRLVSLSSSGGEKRVEEEPGVGACSKGRSELEKTMHTTSVSLSLPVHFRILTPTDGRSASNSHSPIPLPRFTTTSLRWMLMLSSLPLFPLRSPPHDDLSICLPSSPNQLGFLSPRFPLCTMSSWTRSVRGANGDGVPRLEQSRTGRRQVWRGRV